MQMATWKTVQLKNGTYWKGHSGGEQLTLLAAEADNLLSNADGRGAIATLVNADAASPVTPSWKEQRVTVEVLPGCNVSYQGSWHEAGSTFVATSDFAENWLGHGGGVPSVKII